MMSLDDLLKRPEGKTLEFKRDLSARQKVLRTVVAFANTSGGTVVIGVEDGGGPVVGVANVLKEEEKLSNLLSDSITPTLVPDIEIAPWRKSQVLILRVHPSPMRPHYLKTAGVDGGTYVRVGSTNRVADAPMVAELQRYTRNESFDEEPIPTLGVDAIDMAAVSGSFEGVRKVRAADLETLGLTARHQGRTVPTNGGVLLFGRERATVFPDAWIQAGLFEGTDRATILDSAEIRSSVPRCIDEALSFVRRNTATAATIEGARRTEVFRYPVVALREIIVNAVAHTDYSQAGAPIRISIFVDRIEVENPGLLPFGLTIEDIRTGISKVRNRVIGRVFNELRLIEQWGSGIPRMTKACLDAGGQSPLLEEVATRFRVTLFAGPVAAPTLDALDEQILALLKGTDGMTTRHVAEAIGRSDRATRARLASLVERGSVVDVGMGPHDPKRRYVAAEEAGGP